jgi:hypothetical protein
MQEHSINSAISTYSNSALLTFPRSSCLSEGSIRSTVRRFYNKSFTVEVSGGFASVSAASPARLAPSHTPLAPLAPLRKTPHASLVPVLPSASPTLRTRTRNAPHEWKWKRKLQLKAGAATLAKGFPNTPPPPAALLYSTNLIKCATLHSHSLLTPVPSVCSRDLSLHFGPRAAR